jgi:hypothetical protein
LYLDFVVALLLSIANFFWFLFCRDDLCKSDDGDDNGGNYDWGDGNGGEGNQKKKIGEFS